jgi:hypothetical protein
MDTNCAEQRQDERDDHTVKILNWLAFPELAIHQDAKKSEQQIQKQEKNRGIRRQDIVHFQFPPENST